MKERPILFNGPMVRALLEGRKTQTRRLVDLDALRGVLHHSVRGDSIFSHIVAKPGKHKLWANRNFSISADMGETKLGLRPGEFNFLSPFAGECTATTDNRRWTLTPIDPCRLWVRETWATDDGKTAHYRADGETYNAGLPWRPSIHMPRWASRISLEVTEVRIERLQDITEEDAKAEGLSAVTKDGALYKWGIPDRDGLPGGCDEGWPWTHWDADPIQAFQRLWDSIYGGDPDARWSANPWVWVTGFRRIDA